jgi:hypothetical protein
MGPFVPALELARELINNEHPEEALAAIADDHGPAVQALRNRAVRAFGPLVTYRQRHADLKKQRGQTAMHRGPALAGASFVTAVSNLNPRLPAADRDAEIDGVAGDCWADPVARRDAIERLRRL